MLTKANPKAQHPVMPLKPLPIRLKSIHMKIQANMTILKANIRWASSIKKLILIWQSIISSKNCTLDVSIQFKRRLL